MLFPKLLCYRHLLFTAAEFHRARIAADVGSFGQLMIDGSPSGLT
jgi:hypothetical protein